MHTQSSSHRITRIMKNILLYALSSLLFLSAVSCGQELELDVPVEEGGITLNLHNMVPQTRAEDEGVDPKPGVNDLNENLIKTIHYFLYPKDGTDQNTEKEPAKEGVLTGLSSQVDHSFSINVSKDVLTKTLFKYPFNDCDVYVIVNLPDGVLATASDHKLSTLRSMVVNADFDSSLKQESFVMEGLGIASIIDRGKVVAAEGDIEVSRIASKITVGVRVRESFITMDNQTSTNDQVWTPKPQDMLVELVNGATVAVLSGDPTKVEKQKLDTLDNQHRIFSDTDNDKIWTCDQFYSYPTIWDIGSDEEPYLRITLPCETTYDKNVNGEPIPYVDVQTCVYKVILGGERLKSNTWYDLTIDIAVLGNFESQEEVILPIENTYYFVADWSTGKTIESEILGGRYLVVDQNEYILYNENTLSIPFTSSHPCEIVDMSTNRVKNQASITCPDYSKDTADEDAAYAWNSSTWSLKIQGTDVIFSHALRNDLTAGKGNYDYAPYTIKFRIRHSDIDEKGNLYGDIFYRDITITQNPAMLITCHPNRKLDGGYDSSGAVDGGVSVNNGDNYGGVHGLTGGNKNPNMYVISTTVLPSSSNDILADPRSTNVNNLTNWNPAIASAPGIEDSSVNRKLTNYYPTIETEDGWNIIAPKFRIASSYGVTNNISYANAQKRCASYQEDGYPAGRWRLPTQAEIEFIVRLSADGIIPVLFSPGNNYWCAAGRANPNQGGGVTITQNTGNYNTTGPVRCVYDEWYWENTAYPRLTGNNVNFTWGDAAR